MARVFLALLLLHGLEASTESFAQQAAPHHALVHDQPDRLVGSSDHLNAGAQSVRYRRKVR
jgi:hypothetical protein